MKLTPWFSQMESKVLAIFAMSILTRSRLTTTWKETAKNHVTVAVATHAVTATHTADPLGILTVTDGDDLQNLNAGQMRIAAVLDNTGLATVPTLKVACHPCNICISFKVKVTLRQTEVTQQVTQSTCKVKVSSV